MLVETTARVSAAITRKRRKKTPLSEELDFGCEFRQDLSQFSIWRGATKPDVEKRPQTTFSVGVDQGEMESRLKLIRQSTAVSSGVLVASFGTF